MINKRSRARVAKTYKLLPETIDIVTKATEDKNTLPGRTIDSIVAEWELYDENSRLEEARVEIDVQYIKEYIQKLDARLSWIEGLLADAEVTIVKSK